MLNYTQQKNLIRYSGADHIQCIGHLQDNIKPTTHLPQTYGSQTGQSNNFKEDVFIASFKSYLLNIFNTVQ